MPQKDTMLWNKDSYKVQAGQMSTRLEISHLAKWPWWLRFDELDKRYTEMLPVFFLKELQRKWGHKHMHPLIVYFSICVSGPCQHNCLPINRSYVNTDPQTNKQTNQERAKQSQATHFPAGTPIPLALSAAQINYFSNGTHTHTNGERGGGEREQEKERLLELKH